MSPPTRGLRHRSSPRRERAVDDVLAEWDDYGVRFEATLLAMPDTVGGQAVFDAVTHEADIRHALGNEDACTSDAVEVAFDFCCYARQAGAQPALTLLTERGETVAGAGEPVAKLETSQFECVARRQAAGVATRSRRTTGMVVSTPR